MQHQPSLRAHKANSDLAEDNLLDYKWCTAGKCSSGMTSGVGVQVIDPQSWDMIFDRMRALPPSTRHVVMVTTVPVVYPQVRPNMAEMTLLGFIFSFC